MTSGELSGNVAIVTGSSSGIGEAVARRLGGLGATVVVNSSNSVEAGEAVAASIPGAIYLRADISDREQARSLVDQTVERFGRLDLLVNNTVVAQGEVVLVNERYGIRLTRVVPPSERLNEL